MFGVVVVRSSSWKYGRLKKMCEHDKLLFFEKGGMTPEGLKLFKVCRSVCCDAKKKEVVLSALGRFGREELKAFFIRTKSGCVVGDIPKSVDELKEEMIKREKELEGLKEKIGGDEK